MSWGHDEYLYQVLENHSDCKLPEEALEVIRLHSFYLWHMYGEYKYLCDEHDEKTLQLVQEFNKFDLYTKDNEEPDIKALTPYYQSLIDEYVPGKIKW